MSTVDNPGGEVPSRVTSSADTTGATGAIKIDRHKLARSATKEVAPLNRWLTIRTGHRSFCDVPPDPDVVVLPAAALQPLAELANCSTSQLVRVLRDLAVDRS